ncbi:MAG: DUF433 domain-containing protein [Bacteroidota bacterium]
MAKPSIVKEGASAYQSLSRITFDPTIMNGQACIRGMRISVSLIVNLIAHGMTPRQIVNEYPDLEAEDVVQALQYAAWLSREQTHVVGR